MLFRSVCVECGMSEQIDSYDAPFEFLGFSAFEEDEADCITAGYSVNYGSIKFYEETTNSEVSFGLYVALYDLIGEDDILDEEEAPANGVLKIDLSNADYSKASVKIMGIKQDQRDVKLIVGAYVVNEAEGTKEISYLGQGLKDDGDKYSYVTYNYIAPPVTQ